jgi:hypothetical protein
MCTHIKKEHHVKLNQSFFYNYYSSNHIPADRWSNDEKQQQQNIYIFYSIIDLFKKKTNRIREKILEDARGRHYRRKEKNLTIVMKQILNFSIQLLTNALGHTIMIYYTSKIDRCFIYI